MFKVDNVRESIIGSAANDQANQQRHLSSSSSVMKHYDSLVAVDSSSAVGASYVTTAIALVQQYIQVFEINNAIWHAEQTIALLKSSSTSSSSASGNTGDSASDDVTATALLELQYLLALCHYRQHKPKRARTILSKAIQTSSSSSSLLFTTTLINNSSNASSDLQRQQTNDESTGTTAHDNHASTSSNSSLMMIYSSILYLQSLCCFELNEYGKAETILLSQTKLAYAKYKSSNSNTSSETTNAASASGVGGGTSADTTKQHLSLDEWILLSTVRCVSL